MKIVDLGDESSLLAPLSALVHAAFREHAPNWMPTVDDARREVEESLEANRISRVLVDEARRPLGWIGAIPQSDGHVWEIHPLAVAPHAQRRGYGSRLVEDIESLAAAAGALTLWAGTSDETGETNLYGQDLYENPAASILALRSTGTPHAFEFWQRVGFTVVGLMPDAEGPGKPSIHLAKPLAPGWSGSTRGA